MRSRPGRRIGMEGFGAACLRKLACFVGAAAATLWIPGLLGYRVPVLVGVCVLQLVLYNVLWVKTDPDRISGPGS